MRLELYAKIAGPANVREAFVRSNALQGVIRTSTLAATCEGVARSARILLPPAGLSEMFEITTTHAAALKAYPPIIIFALRACCFPPLSFSLFHRFS